jgi:hypothetical protein
MANLPELPDDFLVFLETHDETKPYDFQNVCWWVATRDKLLSSVNIDGEKYPYVYQMRGYTKTIAEFFGSDATADADGNDVALTRLADSLAFATGDGDVLFLLPSENFSVWLFHHDGGDVKQLADSFSSWLSAAELDTDY